MQGDITKSEVDVIVNAANTSLLGLLASCYRKSLTLAAGVAAWSIAFPNISTGAYRFPIDVAGQIAVDTVLAWLDTYPDTLQSVSFVCFETENLEIYQALLGSR